MQTCYLVAQIGTIPLIFLSVIVFFIDVPNHPRTFYQDEKLLLVQVLFSNGQQERKAFIPQSPTDGDIYWLNETSALSLQGQKRLYKLGSTLRIMYQLYLQPRKFNPDLVVSTTGNLSILQTSLQCFHAGMFRSGEGLLYDINWRPVPYSVLPTNDDDLLYQKSLLRAIRELVVDESQVELQQALENIRLVLGSNVTLSDMVIIHSYLVYEAIIHELDKKWTNALFPNMSKALVDHFWDQYANQTQMYAIPLLNLFLKNVNDKMGGALPQKRKLHLYAGHQLNIANILSVLADWSSKNGTIPAASYISMEFVQEISTGYYKIYFYYGKGNNMDNPMPIQPKQCNYEACTIHEFTTLVNSLTLR